MNHSKFFPFYYGNIYCYVYDSCCHYTVILFVQFYFCSATAVLCPCPFIQISIRDKHSSLKNYVFFQQISSVRIQRQILNVLYIMHIVWHRTIQAAQLRKAKKCFDLICEILYIGMRVCVHMVFREYTFNHDSLISQLDLSKSKR